MTVEAFEVGGCVRDEIMGVAPNDIDYTVVAPSYSAMREFILSNGMRIVVETSEFYTIRAVAREPFRGRRGGLDFVWARKEGPYSDGRRPDFVEPGTLFEDLQRRDFCFNAIAKDSAGNYIDPFNGIADIENKIIRAVGAPMDRLREDSLRALRALRFAVTKKFYLDAGLMLALNSTEMPGLLANVSQERIREELHKMFRHDTFASLERLEQFPAIRAVVLKEIWLKPTLEKR